MSAERIAAILQRARETLADPDKERWTDARLLSLLNEGHKDLAIQLRFLRKQTSLYIVPNQADYDLSEDVHIITRAFYKGCELPLVTFDQLDTNKNVKQCWQNTIGPNPIALVYDRVNMSQVRLYPMVDNIAELIQDPTGLNWNVTNDAHLGLVSEAEINGTTVAIDTHLGVIDNLYSDQFYVPQAVFSSYFGVTSGITEITLAAITIQYFALPLEITELSDSLESPRVFDTALKHYVVGNALRDDISSNYRTMGLESLQFYDREIQAMRKSYALNNALSDTRAVTYNNGF